MSRQSTSKRMFGLVMIAVTLLVVACGNGDGDSDPTATTEVNSAAPTLPASEGTAEIEATEDISEDDLTVVKPEIPAATATADEEVDLATVGSPEVSTPAEVGTPDVGPTDLTGASDGDVATPPTSMAASTPEQVDTMPATAQVVDDAEQEPATVVAENEATAASTPEVVASPEAAQSPASTPVNGNYNTPGDGTGGSGQPGERSSNIPGEEDVVATPLSGLAVEGCDVPNVPAFESDVVDYITNAEVNFRSGPGTECTPILDEPLAEAVEVVVIGGPVTQTSDNTVWLQVEVDDVPGWVSADFVEPAP